MVSRLSWVDSAKGISIILVVMVHSHYWLNEIGVATASPWGINEALAEMRLPLFFFAAGLFAVKYLEGPWRLLLTRKIALLAWVFALWQVIDIGYSVLSGLLIQHSPLATVLVRSFAKPLVSLLRPSNELWFLWALCIMFVLAKLLWRSKWWVRLTMAAVPAVTMAALPDSVVVPLKDVVEIGWFGVAHYLVVFIAAALLGKEGAMRVATIRKWQVALVLPASGAIMMLSVQVDLGAGNILFRISGLTFGICLALMFRQISWLTYVGQRTLPIYVMHSSILALAAVVLMFAGLKGAPIPGLAYFGPIVVTTLAIVAALYLFSIWESGKLCWLFQVPKSTEHRIRVLPEARIPHRRLG